MSISIIQNNDVYDVKFPYDANLVYILKQVPGKSWNPDKKLWTIPRDKLGFLLSQLRGTPYERQVQLVSNEQIGQNASLDVTTNIPKFDISNYKFLVKPGAKPFSHQIDFMKYALHRQFIGKTSGFIIGDEMGCIWGECSVEIKTLDNPQSTRRITLSELFELHKKQDGVIFTKVMAFKDTFDWLPVRCVLDKGFKECVAITYLGGTVVCTLDHEILTDSGYVEAFNLSKDRHKVVSQFGERPILNIRPYGVQHVYDVGIFHPTIHNFVPNGLVVHNCGKTFETLQLANFNRLNLHFKHCLIICCVNMSKFNWKDDIEEHSRDLYHPYILGTRLSKRTGLPKSDISSAHKYKDLVNGTMYGGDEPLPYFLITNVESLRYKQGKRYVIVDRIIELINEGKLNMIAIDEVHKNLSPSSTQGKQILQIKKKTEDRCMWLPITGTLLVNKPTDCYVSLRLLDATTMPYYKWEREYCIYGGYGDKEIIGYKNIPHLKFLVQQNMIRRLKKDVLDLPPKLEVVDYVENTPYQKKLYDEVAKGIISKSDEIKSSLNPLAQFMRLRQVNGAPEILDPSIRIDSTYRKFNAKFEQLLIRLEEIHERNEKVLIFSNWVEPLRTIYSLIKQRYKCAVFTGTMSESERQKHKRAFMNNPKVTVMLGTIGAMGTTHTLTAANNVIFYDCPWTMTDYQQACDRVHRPGMTKTVNIYKIITKYTVDERVDNILFKKKGISEFIVDNIDIRNNPELFDLLLSDSMKK